MRSLIVASGLAAVLAAPGFADAQTRCERDNSTNRAAGTIVGAGVGALLGSAIAGNSSNTAGTIAGGVAGAVVGNQIAKRAGEPCPPGYYEAPAAAPLPPPAPAFGPTAFWRDAPAPINQRIDFLERRIREGERTGSLTRREADRAYGDLADIRRQEIRLRRRDGGRLSGADRDYLQDRLDRVGQEVRWAQATPAYPAERPTSGSYDPRGYYDSQGVWRWRWR